MSGKASGDWSCDVKVVDPEQMGSGLGKGAGVIASSSGRLDSIPPRELRQVRVEIDVPNPRKWTAETPELYVVELCLRDGSGNAVHRAQSIGRGAISGFARWKYAMPGFS